jgi:thiamine biosynthesis lipoprotein
MTVIGPDLIWADAYATAAFLLGRDGLAWVADHHGYDAIAVIGDRLVRTPGTDRYLLDPA